MLYALREIWLVAKHVPRVLKYLDKKRYRKRFKSLRTYSDTNIQSHYNLHFYFQHYFQSHVEVSLGIMLEKQFHKIGIKKLINTIIINKLEQNI